MAGAHLVMLIEADRFRKMASDLRVRANELKKRETPKRLP